MFGGGFGQNTQQSSGFGSGNAFGGGTNTGGGFGSSSSPAFGSGNTSGGGLFGNASSSFGSAGGFGANTQTQPNSLFGAGQNRTSGFGSTPGPSTSGGLFGSTNTSATTGNTGFGGFGSAVNTGGGFGSSAGGSGGLFGANKPATGFGSTAGTTGFGASGGASTSGFGSGTAPAFGGGSGTAFNQAVPPSEGTGSTPFTPFTEKDAASTTTNHYQSIVFMQPYSKYSFEELRLGDYNGGRRFGNGSGQAGAFGASAFGSSGFGSQSQSTGFGAGNTSSPFGANTSAPSAFGSQTQTTGGFGSSNTSNPLFGAQKPANTLFGGGTPAAAAAATTQSGLFGSNTATSGGFGNTTPSTGFGSGGLFGNSANNTQQQNKPLFGGSSTATGGGAFGGFGAQNTSAASPFGGTAATSSPFGGQQQQSSGGLFGSGTGFGQQNQAQNQAQTPNKGLFGGFGANTQQQQTSTPSLFGGSNTGTGTGTGTTGTSLFGQNQQTQQPASGGLFGGNTTQQPAQSTSLFGGSQQQGQKSLFGGGTTGTGTGTGTSAFGGFGNTQNQQTGGGSSLFGGGAAQQQQKSSLFGGAGTSGGSLFGGGANTTAPAATGSLFGGGASQNQQPTTLGASSLFGGSQSQPAQQLGQQPAPGSLQASLLEGNPYGNQSIFSGLPAPSAASPGPLATPLSSSNKQKQRTPLPVYKITPTAANRLLTPPKRGYGFSYSTYGSPSSTANTPGGLGGSVLGGSMRSSFNASSLGRTSFSKSLSTSNLRKTFDPEADSVLSPGALSSGSSRLSSGSLKRLTIDRSLRNDLFTRSTSTPPPAAITNGEEAAAPVDKGKKKVSFESSSEVAHTGGEIVPVETQSPEPTPEELGFLRSVRKSGTINGVNGTKTPEIAARPEMESVRNNELPAASEPAQPTATNAAPKQLSFMPGGDPQPGEYFMKPTRAELSKMSREQLKKVVGFTVGRENCGQVTFDEPVDLTTIDLDNVCGGLVDIGVRKITVYPDETIKPPRGKGLNVPSILRIENSWPRGRDKKSPSPLTSGPLFDKHVDRLVKVHNTEFIDYEVETGTWVFKVPHFTTYGLDYDSDEEEEGESLNQSTLSAAPDTPTPKAQTPANHDNTVGSEHLSAFSTDDSFLGSVAGVDDDTFDFKKRKIVPGAFGHQAMETMDDEHLGSEEEEEDSFLEDGSTGSTIEQDSDDITESLETVESEVELDESEEMDMAGTFPDLHHTVERDDTASTDTYMEDPRLSLKPWNTPAKPRLDLTGDWAEQLQRTISPRKQNRDALREIQANAFNERSLHEETPKQPTSETKQKGFATSIDLMNSLFQQPRRQQTASPVKVQDARPKGPEWPYHKQPKTYAGESNELSADDLAFHYSFKPRWGPSNALLCVRNNADSVEAGLSYWEHSLTVTSEGRDVSILKYRKPNEPVAMLDAQREITIIKPVDGVVPFARLAHADFHRLAATAAGSTLVTDHERLLWQLANILFNDELEDDISVGVPKEIRSQFSHRIKKDRLTRLLEGIIRQKQAQKLGKVGSPEERAVNLLCAHRVDEACNVLLSSQNFHLATLVSQIGRDATVREDMAKQIDMWRQSNAYSEMSEPVRALYELLAGNALRSEGKTTGALEDRISAFTFSERFDLDWIQAFGLRLWYGIGDDEPLENAVCKFVEDLRSGVETALPLPNPSQFYQSTTSQDRESPLWVLLKAYAATTEATQKTQLDGLEFPAALLPESLTGDRLTNRLSFQLCHFLAAAIGRNDQFQLNVAQMDQLTWDYAWELFNSGALARSIFVFSHLSRASDRERAIKDILARNALSLPHPLKEDGQPNKMWKYLVTDSQIPENWIWVAKALYARDTGNAAHEVDYLVRAKNWNDAHATFCRIVGPSAVIEGDYATLETLISGFGAEPERKVRGWAQGGGIYEDFLHLATARVGRRDPARLHRLVQALVQLGDQIRQGSGVEGLEERVAFREMSRAVARWTAHEDSQANDLSSVLSLPLTGDARLTQTAEMSRRYYGVIMAGGY